MPLHPFRHSIIRHLNLIRHSCFVIHHSFPLLLASYFLLLAFPLIRAATPDTQPAFSPLDPFTQVSQMHRGINILGYDPLWDSSPSSPRAHFQLKHFQIIHDGGFQTVRVNLQSFRHMNPDNQLPPTWFNTLDWIIQNALAAHLTVILDEHDYNPMSTHLAEDKPKLLAFWKQVGEHCKDLPNSVVFEMLNEPHDQLDAKTWNTLLLQTLAVIRSTNPQRNVIIGGSQWNGLSALNQLELPDADQHLIATFHYYSPMKFTHQGASWVPEFAKTANITWGTDADKKIVAADFAKAHAWSLAHHRPILLGEFGAYSKAPLDSRVQYLSTVARTAEQNNFAWCYWQFDSDFIVYDIKKDAWLQPIHDALIPPSNQ